MKQDEVITILRVADLTPEQARRILDYCYQAEVIIDGEVWHRLPLPSKLEAWLEKRAGGDGAT